MSEVGLRHLWRYACCHRARKSTLSQPQLPVHPKPRKETSPGLPPALTEQRNALTCNHPDNPPVKHEDLHSMWNARKGHPSLSLTWPTAPLSPPNGGVSYPPACVSFPPHSSPIWSNLLLTAHGGCPWRMVLSGMSFPCSLDSPRSKRCGNLSTCMLGTYTQDLSKFHTFPQTAIGAGAPGKKRDMASDLETEHHPHVGMPQDAI